MTTPAPIIVVGAARSGTKLLRDSLAEISGCDAVPYDINYVWRLGNESCSHDALSVDDVSRARVDRIRRYLRRRHRHGPALIEKTVATCLRIGFVDAVVPEARYVFLVRDPVDVVESARRQWTRNPDIRYTLRKSLDYPWTSAPGYAVRELGRVVQRTTRSSGSAPVPWGPLYPGLQHDLAARASLLHVCARQWDACMSQAVQGFTEIRKSPVVVRFDDLVTAPEAVVASVAARLDLPVARGLPRRVDSLKAGYGRRTLPAADVDLIRRGTRRTSAIVEQYLAELEGARAIP